MVPVPLLSISVKDTTLATDVDTTITSLQPLLTLRCASMAKYHQMFQQLANLVLVQLAVRVSPYKWLSLE